MPKSQDGPQEPLSDEAARFVDAVRTIMSLSPDQVADIKDRRITPPNATVRLKRQGPKAD